MISLIIYIFFLTVPFRVRSLAASKLEPDFFVLNFKKNKKHLHFRLSDNSSSFITRRKLKLVELNQLTQCVCWSVVEGRKQWAGPDHLQWRRCHLDPGCSLLINLSFNDSVIDQTRHSEGFLVHQCRRTRTLCGFFGHFGNVCLDVYCRPEEKIKILEKKVNDLIEESCMAQGVLVSLCSSPSLISHVKSYFGTSCVFFLHLLCFQALEKAKEAGRKERALVRQREQSGNGDHINLDLTYSVRVFTVTSNQIERPSSSLRCCLQFPNNELCVDSRCCSTSPTSTPTMKCTLRLWTATKS